MRAGGRFKRQEEKGEREREGEGEKARWRERKGTRCCHQQENLHPVTSANNFPTLNSFKQVVSKACIGAVAHLEL